RRRHGERPRGLLGSDRRDSPHMGLRRPTQLGRGRRDGGHARAARRHACIEERRTRRRFVVVMSPADVRWLAPPGLVRCGGDRVPVGSDGRGPARGEPGGSEALRRARAGGARVEPAGWARNRADGSTGVTTAVTVSAQSVDSLLLIVPPEPATAASVSPATAAGVPSAGLAAAAQCGGVGELLALLRVRFDEAKLDADDTGRFPLSEPADARPAESWLLRSLIKQREGFMSRHVERKISLAITRRLAVTRVTPDVMTVVSVGLGLLGAPFFLSSSPAYQLVGALLFLTHSIL